MKEWAALLTRVAAPPAPAVDLEDGGVRPRFETTPPIDIQIETGAYSMSSIRSTSWEAGTGRPSDPAPFHMGEP